MTSSLALRMNIVLSESPMSINKESSSTATAATTTATETAHYGDTGASALMKVTPGSRT